MRYLLPAILLAACGGSQLPPAAPAPAGHLEHAMRNCPSAVPGAITRVRNEPGGADLDITASDAAARREIIDLAQRHAHMGGPSGAAMQHTGLHGGPGDIGHCPVIHDATLIRVTELHDGVTIHLRAIRPEDVAALQAAIADRVAHLAVR